MYKYGVFVYNNDGIKHTVYIGNNYKYACMLYYYLSNDKSIYFVALYDFLADCILESR